ncbi:MAG: hydrogenase [Clostridiales bacterium]|nr:hydrogenase [Clostridiales bacterium]
MVYFQVIIPIALALVALVVPSNRIRPWLIPITGVIHFCLTLWLLFNPEQCYVNSWLILDPVGKIILLNVSILYLVCSFYAAGYLQYRLENKNRIFVACFVAFIGIFTLVCWSYNLGVMWISIEATTLITAPLIYFNKSTQSIEATWKYLMVGSVGIALALLGTFFLAYSAIVGGTDASMDFYYLLKNGGTLNKGWLQAAFILLLIGYGTKMGLAPMHTWKPDAYGEAPGIVGAILSGGVTSGAFLAITRIWQICNVAGETAFTSKILMGIGLFSMLIASIFMMNQRDFKRMLAYSSVEHMGILIIGLSVGTTALFATFFHVIASTMTKGMLFLSSGNINRAYVSKNTRQVTGAIRRLPISGTLFLIGFLAITGTPPFAPFVSEFMILIKAFAAGHLVAGSLYILFMLVIFMGMGVTVLKVVYGKVPKDVVDTPYQDGILTAMPLVAFLVMILVLGIAMPASLTHLLNEAVSFMGKPI